MTVMTDGERLVWATSFTLVFDRGGDAVAASRAAAHAIEQLREAAARRLPSGDFALGHGDERYFLDEMVNSP